jgi:phosphoenolpyruvate carboxykinase (ATP)
MLAEKMRQHQTHVWLVNTGWSGGGYGVGARMKLSLTRAIIDAIHAGQLVHAPAQRDPVFGFDIITQCPNVPSEALLPRQTWKDAAAYDAAARKLGAMFKKNFEQYEAGATPEVRAAGPAV